MTTHMTPTIRPDVLAMHRYAIQPAAGMVKLDAMENPYDLPPALAAQLGQVLAGVALNRYPAGHGSTHAALRAAFNIPLDLDIMLGNGSDELIHLIIQACATQGAVVMAPVPGFVMYAMSTQFNRSTFVGVPLQADFSLDMPAMLAAIAQHKPAILFIAYPNNPTGNAWAVADIQACIAAMAQHGGVVVMDEAYQPFAADSWLPRLKDAPNVVLVRTLSKLGLAGLRLGYMVASPAWVEQFDKVRPPYNVNVLTLAATDFLLQHVTLFTAQAAQLKAQREKLFTALQAMKGANDAIQPFPSEANFVLARVPNAAAWFDALKAQGILIKNVSGMSPLLANCLRLTVGSEAENTQLIQALQALAQ